ncbi:unnamed protein product, partial [Ectocarpus sp. 8 AP-2014]
SCWTSCGSSASATSRAGRRTGTPFARPSARRTSTTAPRSRASGSTSTCLPYTPPPPPTLIVMPLSCTSRYALRSAPFFRTVGAGLHPGLRDLPRADLHYQGVHDQRHRG